MCKHRGWDDHTGLPGMGGSRRKRGMMVRIISRLEKHKETNSAGKSGEGGIFYSPSSYSPNETFLSYLKRLVWDGKIKTALHFQMRLSSKQYTHPCTDISPAIQVGQTVKASNKFCTGPYELVCCFPLFLVHTSTRASSM